MEEKINYEFFELKTLVNDSNYPNALCIFKSIDNILTLLYSDKHNFIKSYNLSSFQEINEIRVNSIEDEILNIKHCFDKNKKRDLIITTHSNFKSTTLNV